MTAVRQLEEPASAEENEYSDIWLLQRSTRSFRGLFASTSGLNFETLSC